MATSTSTTAATAKTDGKPIDAGGGILVSLALPKADKPAPAWLAAVATRTAAAAKERAESPGPAVVPATAKGKAKPKGTPRPPKPAKAHKAGRKPKGKGKAHKPAKAKPKATKPKGPSGLDAAATVLKGRDKPQTVRAIWEAIESRGLWKPAGATPWQTLSAALQRAPDRFRKAGRGLWALKAAK